MRLLAILAVVGFAAASQSGQQQHQSLFKPGTHYTFKYEGRMLSGLPELATHYSGLGIRCTVKLQVVQDNEYRIQVTDGQYSKVNDQLQVEGTDLSKNWRMVGLPEYRPMPTSTSKHLSTPTILKLKGDGSKKFESLKVSSEEPEWSVNFKKALAVLFNVNTIEPYSTISQNMLDESTQGDQTVTYWKAQEESLEGLCEVTYQINELPKYMLRENTTGLQAPYQQACLGGSQGGNTQFYEIVRSRDVSTCTQRSAAFNFYKPGVMRCRAGNCDGQSTRSSITRYSACGSGRQDMKIQGIYSEGEAEVDLLGFNSEKFVTGNSQNLTLIHQEPISSSGKIGEPTSPVEKKTLGYEYSLTSTSGSSSSYTSIPYVISKLSGKKVPEGMSAIKLNSLGKEGDFNPGHLVSEMVEAITEIVEQELLKTEDQPQQELPLKMLKLARGFSVLEHQYIQQAYQRLQTKFQGNQEQKETMRNVFFDTLLMGGSRNGIQFFKEKVLSGSNGNNQDQDVTDLQAATLLSLVPNYVVVPTEETLDEIFQLVQQLQQEQQGQGHQGGRSEAVYHQGLLGLSTLAHKACVAENRLSSYPVAVYGELCNPESDIIVNKMIPFMKQQLEQQQQKGQQGSGSDEVGTIIVSLGLLGHKNALSVLLPYVQGTPEGQQQTKPENIRMERMLALFSVSEIGKRYPGLVEPAIFSVLGNQAESTELRIAAFNALLSLNPTETYLHRVASLTWREQDDQVLRVVDSAFYSLASKKDVEPLTSVYSDLPRKVYIVYPLTKKPSSRFPSSATFVNSDYLPRLGVAYEEQFSWASTGESYVPVNLYHKLKFLMNRYQYTVFEYGQRLRGSENLIQSLVKALTPGEGHTTRQQYADKIKREQLSPEFKELVEKLNMKVKQGDSGEAAVMMKMFETAPFFKMIKTTNGESLKEKISKFIKKDITRSSICGQHKINVQRITNLQSMITNLPNDMGFPFILETHLPQLLSLKGHLNVDCSGQGFIPKFELKAKQLYEATKIGYVGTVLPFTEEFVSTGVEQTAIVNIPVEFDVTTDTDDQSSKVKIYVQNQQSGSSILGGSGRPIDMLYYQLRPFTVAQRLNTVRPITKSSQFKVIRSPTQPKEKQTSFGQDLLGLALSAELKTESRFTDLRSVFEKLKLFNSNPLNLMRFSFVSTAMSEKMTPSVRFHRIRLALDPSASATKEISFQLKWGAASKLQGEQIKYDTLKITKGERNLESYPEWKKLIPVKIESRPIGQTLPQHQQRQEKLKEMMEKTRLESGHAWILDLSLTLKGGRQRTFHYLVKHASGQEKFLQQNWRLELESANNPGGNKVCVQGEMMLPNSPLWQIHQIRSSNLVFQYKNEIGFGAQCQQHKIQIEGTSRVSEKQKEYSQTSPEAKILETLRRQRVPLSELTPVAQKVRAQASNFDEADFTIKYQTVPSMVKTVDTYAVEYVKSYLWPYIVISNPSGRVSGGSGDQTFQNHWRFRFNQKMNTVDVTLHRQEETVAFKNVRLPGYVEHFGLPTNAVDMMEKGQNTHSSVYPACQVQNGWIKTFNNETTKSELDQCFHLLTGDCSYRKTFAVLARNTQQQQPRQQQQKELKVLVGKTTILLTPSGNSNTFNTDIKVVVNGTQINLPTTSGHKTIKDDKKDYVADVYRSTDGVVTLKFLYCPIAMGPSVILKFNGVETDVRASPMYRSSLCGLCGDLSGLRLSGMVGPERCTYSRPEILTASYRVSLQSHSCPALPSRIESQLRQEKSRCLKVQEKPTKVVESFEAQVGPCSRHTHEIIEQTNRICFSQRPVISCSPVCKASQRQDKQTRFTCMPKGRIAERYAEKARRGEVIQELERMGGGQEITVQLTLPRSCVKA